MRSAPAALAASALTALAACALALAACSGRPPMQAWQPPPEMAPPPMVPAPPRPEPPDPFAANNLDFEIVDGELPQGWLGRDAAALASVTDERHGGARALRIRAAGGDFRAASTVLTARALAGKRVRLHGWIKTEQATEGAVLWLRVDGAAETGVASDTMFDHRITGTAPWTVATVEVDVPADAQVVHAGAMLFGGGTAWFDDLALEVTEILAPERIAIEGTVTGAAGAPLPDAQVALIHASQGIVQHVCTDARGRFRFDTTAGVWGLSAHKAGAVGGFLVPRRFAASERVQLTLGQDGGVTVRGKLSSPPRLGAYVQISRLSPDIADVFAVPVAEGGAFEAILPRSDKYVIAQLGGSGSGVFERKGDRVDAVVEVPTQGPPPAEVVAYIGAHGIPLASVEAGTGFDDLAPLGKLVGGARIVALGEATHGTREFFQVKHRLLEYLVAKQGFTVFAIEANQPECRAINDYVLHGKGDAREVLAGIYFWTWNTEEVLAMIEWMRAWNADPAHPQKVSFTGFDMQVTSVAHATVAALLEKVAPAAAAGWLAPLAVLASPHAQSLVGKASPAERDVLAAGLAALARAFDGNRKAWSAAAGAAAYADARHDLTILEQAFTMFTTPGPPAYEARDLAMADNVRWLLEQTRGKIVVWAHNGHIANKLRSFTNMGSHLRKRYQQAYVNFGFVFGEGSFQALDLMKPARPLTSHTLGPPPEHNASVAFSRTGKPLLVLDLRALPRRGPVRDWFAAPHPVRDTGAVFSSEQNMTFPQVLPRLYDAVIYVDKTTRARPLPSKRNPG
ncbi:MAG TPA: erythromycin esterase family protein [Kofleriaceae bacterium]|nr:erythromycin esterase family protein [Kofleriaceae bacterium]